MTIESDWKKISPVQAIASIRTDEMFRGIGPDPEPSPIDVFMDNTNAINTLYLSYAINGQSLPQSLGQLVLLGYMSAVESYFRTLLRRCILIDTHAQKCAEFSPITYGAAWHHNRQLLPEALFEGISFSGRKGAIEFVRNTLGIKGGQLPREVESAVTQFSAICEIRHCCVHRFGKLGSQNAFKLGSESHATLIERSFEPTLSELEIIADTLRTFIKTINNWIWAELLKRPSPTISGSHSIAWKWMWSEDKEIFNNYYALFSSKEENTDPNLILSFYENFARDIGPRGAPFSEAE